ncbi:MAG: alpha amylase C-terminal domain-containing protein, partial [Cyanobacteria bacterium]|nr:alpha amylase C-terminal domain-containing protein [Cyanobacteriota bacterium]
LKKHNLGLILDGVFNHIGPEGNYFRQYDPNYIEANPVSSEWGDQLNWENPQVVDYVLKVLEMFLKEYQVDGFRFDMSSRIPDHALRTMTTHINKINPNAMIFAEDDRNSNHVTLPTSHGGLGFWGKHNFAWHHRVKGLATGQPHMNAPTDPWSLSWLLEEGFPGPGNKMNSLHDSVNFFESHDEIGNHDGLRTNTKIPRNKFIVGSLLKFVVPGIPWTFQGEETYNPSPFYYFVSHTDPDVIKGTRNGRRYSPQPDCMRPENFTDSKIKWDKADPGITQLNKAMNHLRKTYPSLWQGDQKEMQIDRTYLNSGVLVIRRMGRENPEDKSVIVINLSDYNYRKNYNIRFSEVTPMNSPEGQPLRKFFTNTSPADWEGSWEEVLNTESTAYGGNGWVNQGKEFKNQGDINLPAWSIAVFHKK